MDFMGVVFLGVLGLCIGSFLGALTYRLPRRVSIQKGRSICPNCKQKIFWYDNIPVLSYIILLGKCRNCGQKISLRYPLIESVTAFGFVFIGFNPYFLLVFSVLVAIFVIDLEHQLIPDSLVFFLLVLTIAYLLLSSSSPDFYTRFSVGFLSALFLLGIHLITQGRGMGLGDVKFAVWGGIFVGWPNAISWFFVSFLTGGALAVILILTKKAGLKQKIAFGPFLIVGLAVSYIWGEKILNLMGLSPHQNLW